MNNLQATLDRDGYVVLENFFLNSECDQLVEAGLDLTTKLPPPEHRSIFSTKETTKQQTKDVYFLESNDKIRCFFEKDALSDNGELNVEPALALNKVGHALHYLHPMFRCYSYCDRVQNVCRLLDLKEPAIVQSMYIYKNPGIGSEVVPHQDVTYLYTEPVPPIGFWFALEDATIENGCLWVAPGSHKSGVHRRLIRNPDKDSKDLLIYDKPAPIYPESSFIPVPVKKGTCILIHGHVVHKSADNKSNLSRHAYTFHVIEKKDNNYSPDNWLQEGNKAPFHNIYNTNQLMEDDDFTME